jgi:phage/conjugal plasmid C-4 type zinc finger TraR family protein
MMERLTDASDRATAREAEWLGDALRAQARRAGLVGKSVADSATDCVRCDEPIAPARRAALPGVQLCVACQRRAEKERRCR